MRVCSCVCVGDTVTYRTCRYDSKLITAASEDGRLRCQCVSHADVHVDIQISMNTSTQIILHVFIQVRTVRYAKHMNLIDSNYKT